MAIDGSPSVGRLMRDPFLRRLCFVFIGSIATIRYAPIGERIIASIIAAYIAAKAQVI